VFKKQKGIFPFHYAKEPCKPEREVNMIMQNINNSTKTAPPNPNQKQNSTAEIQNRAKEAR